MPMPPARAGTATAAISDAVKTRAVVKTTTVTTSADDIPTAPVKKP